ncbi:hypothetical protein JR316_0010591 [Psilocybe cubensis]|uniref:Uncharacterized protein n=2 Tax=Psilocybe cubensis TaxID=181762 RepID=A0ACB8GMQ5_PSICU|nr:hypothetical protein JR316_0010591 [Psilocybe cubensis]KAH9476677.1 hypothetical protein JR316_0010591 [Psilocybe cubensis]
MSRTNIILSTPHNYDLQGLAETTQQSLSLLKPWTTLPPSPSNPLIGEISTKAANYVSAIQMGVSAAYSGFTVTEEVLFLAKVLPVDDQEDLKQYLVGMMDLAREARENANSAFQAFRNVRTDIYETMSKLTEQLKSADHPGHRARDDYPQYRKEDLDVLVKFSEYLSKYAEWWDWIKVETDPSSSSKNEPLAFQLDSLTDPEAVKRWTQLRSQYTAYVQMIGEFEDSDPQFFNRSISPSPEAAGQSSTNKHIMDVSSTPSSTATLHASSHATGPQTVNGSSIPPHKPNKPTPERASSVDIKLNGNKSSGPSWHIKSVNLISKFIKSLQITKFGQIAIRCVTKRGSYAAQNPNQTSTEPSPKKKKNEKKAPTPSSSVNPSPTKNSTPKTSSD